MKNNKQKISELINLAFVTVVIAILGIAACQKIVDSNKDDAPDDTEIEITEMTTEETTTEYITTESITTESTTVETSTTEEVITEAPKIETTTEAPKTTAKVTEVITTEVVETSSETTTEISTEIVSETTEESTVDTESITEETTTTIQTEIETNEIIEEVQPECISTEECSEEIVTEEFIPGEEILEELTEAITEESTEVIEEQPAYSISDSDFEQICKVVEAETHQCDKESKKHIVHVIMNRVNNSSFPNSISSVCKQKNQFARRSDVEQSTRDAVAEALNESDTTDGALFFCTCSKGCYASKNKTWLFKDSCGHNFWK